MYSPPNRKQEKSSRQEVLNLSEEKLWNKRERMQEVIGDMMQMAPPMLRNLLPLFTTQFQAQFSNLEEEDLDNSLNYFQSRLDYIRGGDEVE